MKGGETKKRKRRVPFSKYEKAVNKTDIIDWIFQEIEKSENGSIKVKIIDLVKELDIKNEKITYTAIYTAMDYVLFKRDIIVNLQTLGNEKLLVLRKRTEKDIAPPWIEKLLQKEIGIKNLEEDVGSKRKVKIQQFQELEEENKKIETNRDISEVGIENKVVPNDEYENIYKVEVLIFDYGKLGWKIKWSKFARNDHELLELIKDGISRPDARSRIEVTVIKKKKERQKEKDKENKGGIKEKEDKEDDKGEQIKEKEETDQPQEVVDKLSQLLPENEDSEHKEAVQYLIQRYKKNYPEKNKKK